ncbi:hypothetical protein [Acidithiobacillus ferrivorans]|uniref:hypothetical protein n=1 Tax=Acidithiobacillus ferrivorans TaxID=160808 RepID=UPI0012E05A86|nr:hypothetical protein [Acidithiobacillus ferrivorans]
MIKRKFTAVTLCLMLYFMPAYGSAGTAYESYGVGSESCGTYLQHYHNRNTLYDSSSYFDDASWVEGWLSASNQMFKNYNGRPITDLLHNTDINGAMLWIANYCNVHPLKSLYRASSELAVHLFLSQYESSK